MRIVSILLVLVLLPAESLALWDVLQGMHALQWSQGWLESFAAVGWKLRADEVRTTVEQFLDDALARC